MASHWQQYIESNIVKSRFFTHGAIHGLNGAKWAQSDGLEITKKQVKELLKILQDEKLSSPRLINSLVSNSQALTNVSEKSSIFSNSGDLSLVVENDELKRKLSNLSQISTSLGNVGLEINFNGNQMFRVVNVDKYCALLACWNFGDSDNASSIPFCKVFNVEKGEFLIPPTHVFYCVTTSMCILIGLVNNSCVLPEDHHNNQAIELTNFDVAMKTLDKFADYLLESGY
ncbi:predicted protein [Naegleria gruberi]|uniref:Predicted protein n=1 Tax=Naegleria gruberi TaxID=5762 RepID=D2V3R7_NAEGR|nr:uncharacterized protein NAEGRDRAFT_63464 [Naegleria gruberi]EFC48683.1 predicted protein [Naegleria gruberi]|eukprot:XP_002681427.1 predicted protein [Naegleria gruberi strain NEG-M]